MLGASVRTSKTDDVAEKVTRGVRRGMRDAADTGFAVSQEEAPVDRGTLLQSGVPPDWVDQHTLVWGYLAEYARYVEEGTAPHHPPVEPLRGWARRVLGDESAAHAVQQSIAQEGTPAQPYVEPGFEAMVRQLRERGLAPYIDDEFGP